MPLRLEWAVLANVRVPYSFTSATRCLREDTTTRLGCVCVIKYGHLNLLTTASGKPDGSGVCQRLPAFLPRPHAFTCRPVPLAARPTPANHVVRVAHKRARRRCGRGVWLHAGAGTGLPRRTGATTARCGVHAVAAARNDLIVGVQRVVEAGAEGHDAQSKTSPRMPSTRCVIGAIRSVAAIRHDGEQVGAVRNSFCAATRLGKVA